MGPLTALTFFPLLGMIVILLLPKGRDNIIRWAAAAFTFVPLVISTVMIFDYNTALIGVNDPNSFQFVEKHAWIGAYNINYYVGVDGISFPLVWLTALLSFLCIFASWGITKSVKGYMAMFLLLETGMMGTFVALDFFLFYVFWEIMLLPMYFLIGIWGGPRRVYAAIKFFLYTLAGSVLMLLAMILLYQNTVDPVTGRHTFDMITMMNQANQSDWLRATGTFLGYGIRSVLWMALFIGFAIKVPVFPFHTWLPDAHVEAPTAISVILAGILLKMGTYGMLRINFAILPDATLYFTEFLAILGVVNIVYGAFCAMAQKDLKKLVAYSSISHMGYVLLGMSAMTPAAINGAVFQMFNHGTIAAMLFLLVGVVYDRAHHREINGFGGIGAVVPRYMGMFALAFFASLGLPGMSGFISEVLVFLGSYQTWPLYTIIAVFGIVITAAYLLWTIQRVFFGPLNEKYKDLPDINGRELFTLIPLAVITIILGVYPHPVLNIISGSLNHLITLVQPAVSVALNGF
ncbi:MAG: NADH-quinone oxidoreductase subunit M [bacterium]|nr:NADH-quinone oxidoreductase subunit M [bacterium]